jgi:hypothetical protein
VWWFETDVSKLLTGLDFKGQAGHLKSLELATFGLQRNASTNCATAYGISD